MLGGAGLVGSQIARQIAKDLKPETIVIASLFQREVREVVWELRKEFPQVKFEEVWGNIFARKSFSKEDRHLLVESRSRREETYQDLFGDIDKAYEESYLVSIIRQYKPDVIIDAINTATAISYQDVYTGSFLVRQALESVQQAIDANELRRIARARKQAAREIEILLISQAIPQLIRHTQLIYRAMVDAGTRIYLKIGTTGTGGMGLNIPYTHSEDKPSALLMSKTAVAFAHTGLLFLMARTPGGPVVKEIKPGAMIGYKKVSYQTIKDHGHPVYVFASKTETLKNGLRLRLPEENFQRLDELRMVGIDTGENGFFARGEFETITSLNQMEFVTPEEIAWAVVLEIKGSNTGLDVIASIDSAVMNPSYRAGYLRQLAISQLKRLEKTTNSQSVAIGQLGPPELSKLLYEAYLLKTKFKTLDRVIETPSEDIAQSLYRYITRNSIRDTITSIGIPILTPDGGRIIRGPLIKIPERKESAEVAFDKSSIDEWARKGWVDLRPKNIEVWQSRFKEMRRSTRALVDEGSAAVTMKSYSYDEIHIGEVVGWIFNNEEKGYRIK